MVRRLWPFLRPDAWAFTLALVLTPATVALSLVQPWLLKRAIDDHLVPRVAEGLMTVGLLYIAATVVAYIIVQGIGAVSWEFLTDFPRNGMKEGGILPAVIGTVVLTFGTAIASIPISIGAAIYLAEYARDSWLTRAVRMAIVNLAGIPSVVYGLFGLGLFVLFLACFAGGGAVLQRYRFAPCVYRAMRLHGHDVCTRCGYWLRGLDEGTACCPECGTEREETQATDE